MCLLLSFFELLLCALFVCFILLLTRAIIIINCVYLLQYRTLSFCFYIYRCRSTQVSFMLDSGFSSINACIATFCSFFFLIFSHEFLINQSYNIWWQVVHPQVSLFRLLSTRAIQRNKSFQLITTERNKLDLIK